MPSINNKEKNWKKKNVSDFRYEKKSLRKFCLILGALLKIFKEKFKKKRLPKIKKNKKKSREK